MKKLVCESLAEFSNLDGKGKNLIPSDVNHKQLEIGIKVEKEHSSDKMIATRIALDHLAENPEYYTELVQSGLVDEPAAIKKYIEFFGTSKLPANMEIPAATDDEMDEAFKSKRQQRYFYARAGDKSLSKKKRNKWKRMAKEFSDKTNFSRLPA
jgi:hypothetical protein